MLKDNNIGFFQCDLKDNYKDFVKEYKTKKEILLSTNKSIYGQDQGEIWFSYVPWFNISSLITPFDKTVTIPQFIWDKFTKEEDKYYLKEYFDAENSIIKKRGEVHTRARRNLYV